MHADLINSYEEVMIIMAVILGRVPHLIIEELLLLVSSNSRYSLNKIANTLMTCGYQYLTSQSDMNGAAT